MVTPLQPAKRVYFTNEDDLHLLREVVGQNPYEDSNRWNIIQMNIVQIIGKFISVRTLKERVKSLVNKFQQKDRILQFQSGIEEEITEQDDLLRHIVDLINEFKTQKSMTCKKPVDKTPKKRLHDSSYQKGLIERTLATQACKLQGSTSTQRVSTNVEESLYDIVEDPNMDLNTVDVVNEIEITNDQENTIPLNTDANQELEIINKNSSKLPTRNILTPARKRAASSLKQHTLAYLTKKNERWFEIRSRELALQEREKSLQEKKFELENWERRKIIELEEKKSNIQTDIFKNQQRLIEIALQRNA